MTVKKISDNGSLGSDIPPVLQAELDAMNSTWQAQGEQQRQRMEEQAEPETNDLAEYRIEILGKAAHVVSQDRNVEYGSPEDTFATIAALWNAYLGGDHLLTTDVANMMVLMKVARLAVNPTSEDGWVDVAGYAACGAGLAKALEAEINHGSGHAEP